MSESTEYPINISKPATVLSESGIPARRMNASGITRSENAEMTTAIDGTNVRKSKRRWRSSRRTR